jgi:hypothetical protein
MAIDKAAVFVDNSNIFKGMQAFSKYLVKKGELKTGQYFRIRWEKVIEMLESQNGGLDVYARHFFASLPPAADVSRLKRRPTEEEWEKMVKKSAQSGFYKVIQNPPFNFTLHGIPLRFREMWCGGRMRSAYFRCIEAHAGSLVCGLKLDPEECYNCNKRFLFKFEKGVDVALAAELVIFGGVRETGLDRIILVAGDGDYKEAIRFVRRVVGKDVQIVSWGRPLSADLAKLANKPSIILDDYWRELCEIRTKPPLEEIPATDEDEMVVGSEQEA